MSLIPAIVKDEAFIEEVERYAGDEKIFISGGWDKAGTSSCGKEKKF
jgi:hypothetical protein